MLPWLLAPLVVGLAARAYRHTVAQSAERAYGARFPASPDGIACGAEAFTLQGTNGRALLLLHGSGDTPQTLRFLAERLNGAGYTVHAPLLPGHGRSPRAFSHVSADAYMAAARQALGETRAGAQWVGVVGLSMGGALATQLAAQEQDVGVLVLLAPYLAPPALVRWAARTSWGWGAVTPHLEGRGERSVHDPSAQGASRAYGVFPPRALRALVATADAGRKALGQVAVPTLVVNSLEDNRISREIATSATETLRAPTERHWLTGCGHIITVDYCKSTVADLVLDFLARHAD
jgi:carboxylesterase